MYWWISISLVCRLFSFFLFKGDQPSVHHHVWVLGRDRLQVDSWPVGGRRCIFRSCVTICTYLWLNVCVEHTCYVRIVCTSRAWEGTLVQLPGTLVFWGCFQHFFWFGWWLEIWVSTREEEFVCRGVFRGCAITIENGERGYPVVQEFAILHNTK